jgi:hypothetical protein
MDEQATDVLSDDALDAESEDTADLGDAVKKKGEGFVGKTIDL